MHVLYLGSDPSRYRNSEHSLGKIVIHFPVIEILPRPLTQPDIRSALDDLDAYTDVIFTSKHAVIFLAHALQTLEVLSCKRVTCVGKSTAEALEARGILPSWVAKIETQEGILSGLRLWDWEGAYVLMPRSALARGQLEHFFIERAIRYQVCDLYDTVTKQVDALPDLDQFEEIVFTSPSTVRAFAELFQHYPKSELFAKKLTPIGLVTAAAITLSF